MDFADTVGSCLRSHCLKANGAKLIDADLHTGFAQVFGSLLFSGDLAVGNVHAQHGSQIAASGSANDDDPFGIDLIFFCVSLHVTHCFAAIQNGSGELGFSGYTVFDGGNGIATLDSSGKVPSSQLPSYVDDVIEGYLYEGSFYEDAQHTELITPESSKIYTDLSTNKIYRWGGSAYVDVTGASAWGEIVGTLSNQTDLQIELNRAYTKTASETSSIDDLDLIPVQKISASSDGRRNIKFRNLKSVLKTYFDDEYISASVEDETLILG